MPTQPFFHSSLLLLVITCATISANAQFGDMVQYFPHYAAGGGATTFFTIHNPSASPITVVTVDVALYRSNGSLFASDQVTLPGGATQTVSFGGQTGPTDSGWAQLSSTGNFTASELFEIAGISNVGVLPSQTNTQLKLFAFLSGGTRTGFAMANPSTTTSSSVTVQTANTAGTFLGQTTVVLPPLQHTAVFLDESPYFMNTDGSVTVTATQPIIAVTLRLDDGTKLAGVPVVTPSQQGTGLTPGAVTTEFLANGAVTSEKIADELVLGGAGSSAVIDLLGSSGGGGMLLDARGNGGAISLFNSASTPTIGLTAAGPNGGEISLTDNAGNRTVGIFGDLLGAGGLGTTNSSGNIVAGLGTLLSFGGIVFIGDPTGSMDLAVMRPGEFGGEVVANNKFGLTVAQLQASALGGGGLAITNSVGSLTAGMEGSTGLVFGNLKSFIVDDPTNSERMIQYTSLEGPEAAIYTRGTAELESGQASIEFPDHFSVMAAPSSITVTLTPRSAASRGLAAVEVTTEGIEVAELAGGSGSYPFDYVAHAVRKGYEDYEVYVAKDPETGIAAHLTPISTSNRAAEMMKAMQTRSRLPESKPER